MDREPDLVGIHLGVELVPSSGLFKRILQNVHPIPHYAPDLPRDRAMLLCGFEERARKEITSGQKPFFSEVDPSIAQRPNTFNPAHDLNRLDYMIEELDAGFLDDR